MVVSVLAFIALVVSLCIRDRKKSLFVQSLNCLLEALYNFIISAYTGAVLGLINFVRSFIYMNKDKVNKVVYLFFLFFFEMIIIINCIITWQGYISILPTIGSIIRTYCFYTYIYLVRLSGVTTGIFYGIYYIYYESWFMVLGDIILIITGCYALFVNDIKKDKKIK